MDNTGWILTYRKIRKHWTWPDGEYSKLEAWLDLLFEAEYETTQASKKGRVVKIERGEQLYSKRKLAEKWQWSRTKLNNFLDWLKHDKMITIEKTDLYYHPIKIKICKYDLYQKKKSQVELSEPQGVKSGYGDPKHQPRAKQNTNKNTKCQIPEGQEVNPSNQTPKTPTKKPIKTHNINVKKLIKEYIDTSKIKIDQIDEIIKNCNGKIDKTIEIESIKFLWNLLPDQISNIEKITPRRKEMISDLWDNDVLVTVKDWLRLFRQILVSDYLSQVEFDWIISSLNNAVKVLEGKYQSKPNGNRSDGFGSNNNQFRRKGY